MFSIIICTFNKSSSLANVLDSIIAQEYHEYEVIVVDNNSSDNTKEIVEQKEIVFKIKGISLRYIYEEKQGLSYARNTGSKISKYQNLIYLDDDCILTHNVLLEYSKTLFEFKYCVISGGSITPRWNNNQAPEWLPQNLYWLYGEMKYRGQNKARLLEKNETINGGNFFIRKDILDAIDGFNPNLGHKGTVSGGSEEQDILSRIKNKKLGNCTCTPAAHVLHYFPIARLNKNYVIERLYSSNYDRALTDFGNGKFLFPLLRVVLYFIKYTFSPKKLLHTQYKGYLRGFEKYLIMLIKPTNK